MAKETELDDPLLRPYPPSERRAIVVHKYFLGLDSDRDPGLATAIESWEQRHARDWRRRKKRREVEAQIAEIEKHKFYMSRRAGRDVGWEAAARDWISKHAAAWRSWWEGLFDPTV